jgi:hypothetical protein
LSNLVQEPIERNQNQGREEVENIREFHQRVEAELSAEDWRAHEEHRKGYGEYEDQTAQSRHTAPPVLDIAVIDPGRLVVP